MLSFSFMIYDKLTEVSTTFSEFNINLLSKRVYSNKIRNPLNILILILYIYIYIYLLFIYSMPRYI